MDAGLWKVPYVNKRNHAVYPSVFSVGRGDQLSFFPVMDCMDRVASRNPDFSEERKRDAGKAETACHADTVSVLLCRPDMR